MLPRDTESASESANFWFGAPVYVDVAFGLSVIWQTAFPSRTSGTRQTSRGHAPPSRRSTAPAVFF